MRVGRRDGQDKSAGFFALQIPFASPALEKIFTSFPRLASSRPKAAK
jgi:hypothetical protein